MPPYNRTRFDVWVNVGIKLWEAKDIEYLNISFIDSTYKRGYFTHLLSIDIVLLYVSINLKVIPYNNNTIIHIMI